MYYFLRQNLFDILNIIEVTGHTEETGKFLWTAGARFDEELPPQTLTLDSSYGTEMADFFDTSLPLMSDRLIATLHSAGVDNFDAYPMVLERPDTGQLWKNYSAVNVIGRIDAVNMAKSKYAMSPLGKPKFQSISIDAAAAGDAICFRLRKGPGLIVVQERIAEAVAKQNFVAVMLQKVEDYDGD